MENQDILRRAATYLDRPPALTGKPLPPGPATDTLLIEGELSDLARSSSGGLPFLVVRLEGAGPAEWAAVMRLGDGVQLLRQAGYGDAPDLATDLYGGDE